MSIINRLVIGASGRLVAAGGQRIPICTAVVRIVQASSDLGAWPSFGTQQAVSWASRP